MYFVNHVTKTTQWDRPKLPAQPQELTNGSSEAITAAPPSVPSRSSTCSNLRSGSTSNGVPERTHRRHSSEIVVQSNDSPSRKLTEETSSIALRSKSNNESVREQPPSAVTIPSSSSTSVLISNNTDKDNSLTPISPVRQNLDSSVTSAAIALSNVSIECTSPIIKNNTANNNNNNSVTNKKVVNSTNTVNNNIENEGSNSAAIITPSTPDRNGISSPTNNDSVISTDSQTETQAQRCRRSSRNLEDISRRRSSRGTRQSSSTQNNRIGTRPSMDLPSGYGLLLFFFLILYKIN